MKKEYISENFLNTLNEGVIGGLLGWLAGSIAGGSVAGKVATATQPAWDPLTGTPSPKPNPLVALPFVVAGTYLGHKIQQWMNLRKETGIKKCKGDPKCEIRELDRIIRETKSVGTTACRKSQNPAKCLETINKKITDFENMKRKAQNKL